MSNIEIEYREFEKNEEWIRSIILLNKWNTEFIWLSMPSFKALLRMLLQNQSGSITKSKLCLINEVSHVTVSGPSLTGKSIFNLTITASDVGEIIHK